MKAHSSRSYQLFVSLAILGVLIVAGFVLVRSGHDETKAPEPTPDPNVVQVSSSGKKTVNIETQPAAMSSIQDILQTTGQLSFPSDQTIKIAPRLQGRVAEVFVHVGDHVAAGQSLAVLESIDAATAQNAAFQADNKLKLARLTLERFQRLQRLGTPDVTAAQAALDQAIEGQSAAQKALDHIKYQGNIGAFADKPMEDAENNVVTANSTAEQARSDLDQAQRDFERKRKLLEIGVIATQDLEASQNTLEKAKANSQAAQDALKLAQQAIARERKAYDSHLYSNQQIEQAEAAYRQARLQRNAADTALRLAKAQVLRDLDQAQNDFQAATFDAQNAHHALDLLGHPSANGSMTITSPITGIVTERDVSPGQVVDQSQMTPWQMFVVSNSSTVWVDADVYEKDIARVRQGSALEVSVAAIPGKTFAGTVLRIAPMLDKTSRSVKVRAEIPNTDGLLRDGEYAEVSIPLGLPRRTLVVPLSAISHEGDNDFVYVSEGDKYRKHQVKLGTQQGQRTEILDGIKPGDVIAVKGAIFLGGQISDD
jgi:membrane fusion protein, heavy metal efflux system